MSRLHWYSLFDSGRMYAAYAYATAVPAAVLPWRPTTGAPPAADL